MDKENNEGVAWVGVMLAIVALVVSVIVMIGFGCDIQDIEDDIKEIHLEATIEARVDDELAE